MRNVLLLITGAYTVGGGIAAVNRLVIKALTDWNHDGGCRLTILALHEPPVTSPDPFYSNRHQTIWKAFSGNTLAFAMEAWRCVLSRRYDVTIADMLGISSILTPLSCLGLCSYFVWCFGLEISKELLSPRHRWALFHAQNRLAISPTTRQNVLQRFPMLDVRVCELAIDPKFALQRSNAAMDGSLRLTSVSGAERVIGKRAILCVGRMWSNQRHKGQDALIRAMPHILSNYADAQLILAGGGDWRDDLVALAQANDVGDSVFMPGFVADEMLSHLYLSSYLFAMPSKGEGFGLVYLEAMRWSKPCIGGRLDAARDVIIDHQTGLLLDEPHNPEQIAAAVILLLSNPRLAREMGRAGRKRLEERYLYKHFRERFYHALGWI